MADLRTLAFVDCALRQRELAADPAGMTAGGVTNLFTRASALGDRHRTVCEEVGIVMHHRIGLRDVREALLDLAADALLVVEAIDASGGHVGAVLLSKKP